MSVAANLTSANSGIFSPTHATPSKAAVASGRAFLHRASPSPRKDGVLSPHPRQQAAELLKRSAETRRLLRERLVVPVDGVAQEVAHGAERPAAQFLDALLVECRLLGPVPLPLRF